MSPTHQSKDGSMERNDLRSPTQSACPGESCCGHFELEKIQLEGGVIEEPSDLSSSDRFRTSGSVHGASSSCTLQDSGLSDIEKGSTSSEHVILQFQGSNCPGCTSSISNALSSMPPVHNLQMNTILLQAEFDLDLANSSICDVVESVRRTTGRACKRIEDGWQEIDVMVPSIRGQLPDVMLPLGVKDVTWLGKDIHTMKYDAKIIGVRKLLRTLSKNLDSPVSLAPPKTHDELPTDIRTTAYKTILSSVFAIPILILAWAPLPEHQITYAAVSLALATVIQVVIAGPFYPKALRSLILIRRIDMDLLIVLSTSMAYGLSIVSFIGQVNGTSLASGACFETSALLITFIMMGRLMSDFACHRSVQWRSVKSLQPQVVHLTEDSNPDSHVESEMDARLLQFGDRFKVKPGYSVVTDGRIISGASEFDESIVTGEAGLVTRGPGSSVIAGSINQGGTVLVQLTRLPGENTIDEITGIVEELTQSKLKTQQIADRVAGWIVPAVGMLAILTLVVWFAVGTLALNQSIGLAIRNAIPYVISVLVVTCPCALGLAVPMVLIVASRIGIKKGIVFKSAEAMKVAKDVTHVVFDKTGTLTETRLSVVSEEYWSESRSLTTAIVLALTRHSEHPVSSAVSKHLEAAGLEPAPISKVTSVVGNGLEGTWNGQIVQIGNARWLGVETSPPVQSLLSKNLTVLCVAQGGRLVAIYGLEAALRNDACSVVATLMERGISVSILSGDEIGSVQKVAAELKVPHDQIKARCTPLQKQQHVKELMQVHKDTVLFCGDGINDAAALAQASLGLLMHNDRGLVHNAADAMLMTPSLSGLLVLINLSRHSYRQVIFNLSWALVYNVVAILLAAGAFIKVRLPPEYAGLGEAVSVIPIILVPLHLQWRNYA